MYPSFVATTQNISLTVNIFCPAVEEKPSKEPDHTWPVQVVITDGDFMVVDEIITIMIIELLTIITITIIISNHDRHYPHYHH